MNNTTRVVIFAVFIACAGLMLFGPSIWRGGSRGMGELPAQNSLPQVDSPMFVEFFSEDCGICRELEPGILELAKMYGNDIEFIHIDTNDMKNYEIVNQFQVYGLPTFYWITTDRRVLDSHEGYISIKKIEARLVELIKLHKDTMKEVPQT